ncbi:MAG: CcmD family protein [Candidatus Kapabacteria bacterium]|nr:CcmD family protein [Candidatus Kapabacteria bacterium]
MIEFLTKNAIYVVLIIALTVWGGIAWYLSRLERRITTLEKQTENI